MAKVHPIAKELIAPSGMDCAVGSRDPARLNGLKKSRCVHVLDAGHLLNSEIFPFAQCDGFLVLGLMLLSLATVRRWVTLRSLVNHIGRFTNHASEISRLGYETRACYGSPAMFNTVLSAAPYMLHG